MSFSRNKNHNFKEIVFMVFVYRHLVTAIPYQVPIFQQHQRSNVLFLFFQLERREQSAARQFGWLIHREPRMDRVYEKDLPKRLRLVGPFLAYNPELHSLI